MKFNKPITFAYWKNPDSFFINNSIKLWGLTIPDETPMLYNIDVETELMKIIGAETHKDFVKTMLENINQQPGLPIANDMFSSGIRFEDLFNIL